MMHDSQSLFSLFSSFQQLTVNSCLLRNLCFITGRQRARGHLRPRRAGPRRHHRLPDLPQPETEKACP